jgi:hypothetical protein
MKALGREYGQLTEGILKQDNVEVVIDGLLAL